MAASLAPVYGSALGGRCKDRLELVDEGLPLEARIAVPPCRVGMVVKPLDFIARERRGPVQPAVECRGRDYRRIIDGPEYTRPEHIVRLRSRGLNRKRALALREFALGIEAWERFVRGEPLRRTPECVFGVLALENEPIDPRL